MVIRDNWQTIRTLKPEIRTYLCGYFVFMFSFAGMRAVLMNLYMLRLGYGLETIGVLNGLTYGTFALFALPAGCLAKRFGVAPMIVTGAILAGFLPGALGHLTGFGTDGPAVYRHSFMLTAMVSAVPIATSLRMGRIRTAEPSGGEQDPQADALDVAVRADPEAACVHASAATRLIWVVGMLALITFLSTMGHTASHSFYNLLLEKVFSVPVATIGFVMGLSQIIKLPGALMAPSLTKRYGPYRLMLASSVVRSSAVLAIALAPHWIWTAVALLVSAVVESAAAGAGDLFNQSIVKPGDRAIMAGAFTTAFGVGGATLLFAGGFIAASVGFSTLYLIASATGFASVTLLWSTFHKKVGDLLPDYHAGAATPATAKL